MTLYLFFEANALDLMHALRSCGLAEERRLQHRASRVPFRAANLHEVDNVIPDSYAR